MSNSIRWPPHTDELQSLETEIKYVAPAHRTSLALRMLEHICEPDPQFPFGVVSSIYYDSKDWDYLEQKRDSDYLKTKVRLRWYEQTKVTNSDRHTAYAEIKYRIGSKRVKTRIPTEYCGEYLTAITLDDRELLKIPAALIANGAPIRKAIFPVFIVRYCRRRYVDRVTGARVCIDYKITAPKSNKHMLANTFPCSLQKTVLEIKGTHGTFPVSLTKLLMLGFRRESFSKYYECYGQLTRTLF